MAILRFTEQFKNCYILVTASNRRLETGEFSGKAGSTKVP